MTGDEYLFNLMDATPRNVPRDYLRAGTGTLIVSRHKWNRLRAELWHDLWHEGAWDEQRVYLCEYPVGLVDVDGIEQLVPDDSAIAFLEVGDYVIRCGKLYHVTGVGAYGPKGEGRRTDISLVSDITFPK